MHKDSGLALIRSNGVMSTTRFSSKPKSSAPLLCKWSGCEAYENGTEFENVEELARHVRITHVEPFQVRFYDESVISQVSPLLHVQSQDVVVCQWEKCKVYNVPSSSIQWLQRHVQQAHTKVHIHCIWSIRVEADE